ncbi:MAG: TolC family protein, partial [Burkholderiaceae bacterium]|nr:TolC family protein [Burkholderiaceae bacterium]
VSLARAQFYPNVSLNAFVGFSSIGVDKLLQPGSLQYGLGPSIRLPLFDTGRLRAQLHGSAAELDAAVAAYNGAVIEAVREASDQLRALQSVQSQQQAQQTALLNAEASRQLQTQRFEAGLGNKLALLSARGNALQQQRQMLDLYAQQLDTQVSLVRALGGDWQDLPKR